MPKYLAGLWAGLGGQDFFFYGPLPFFVAAAVADPICSGCGPETLVVLAACLFWVTGGATFYLFMHRYLEARFAAIGAIVYSLLPYHLFVDWLVRQALGEFATYTFLPLVAYGLDAIRKREPHGWVLSLGITGTLLCHLPMSLLAGHVFGLVVLIMIFLKARNQDLPFRFANSWCPCPLCSVSRVLQRQITRRPGLVRNDRKSGPAYCGYGRCCCHRDSAARTGFHPTVGSTGVTVNMFDSSGLEASYP